MTEITIPRPVYEAQLERLQGLYREEFGDDALSSRVQSFSRPVTIRRYARAIDFWERHTPEVRPGLSIEDVAAHAACTNAAQQLRLRADELGVAEEVERLRGRLEE